MPKKYVIAIVKDLEKLSRRSDEIDAFVNNPSELIADLKDTIRATKDLVALSAPQIGRYERVFCINFNGDIRAFINPIITESEGFKLVREKSPSIPDKEFIVPRNEAIIAKFQKPNGTVDSNRFEGVVAEVFQHQVGLLDGVTIADYGLEVFPEFDKASKKEQAELLEYYIQQLKSTHKQLQEDIESDEEMRKIVKGADFINALIRGEVEIEYSKEEPIKEEEKETPTDGI